MCDKSPKNGLEESSSDRANQSGHISAPTNKSDLPERIAFSNMNLSSKYIGNQKEVNMLGDDSSSCGSRGVTRSLSQSSVSRSDSLPAHSQQGLTLGGAQHCAVCDQVASGHFFGALVCLPCKSFFIRCTRGGDPCIRQQCCGDCDVKKQFRNRCQFCRYQKCVTVGMSRREKPECIQPEEGQELCQVCGDLANGIHFGVYTCEGCKKFFRRGLKEHQSYVCKGKKKCGLNPRNRNDCRSCRYQKCVKVGMSREAIKMGRPRKPYQSSRISDTALPLETSSMSSDSDSNKHAETQSVYNNGGVVVKLEVVKELLVGGSHTDLKGTATRFQNAQPSCTDSKNARGPPKRQESKVTHAQDQQPGHSCEQREVARACSSQSNGRTSKDSRQPQSWDTSLVNCHSVSRRQATRSNSLGAGAHATCPPLLSASERVGYDSTSLLERYKHHQCSWSGTDLAETTSGFIEHALEKTLHALDSNKDCKQHLFERPYSGAADGDRKVSVTPRAATNHFDLIHTHLEDFLSVSSHILSHYCVENYALLLPEIMVIPLRLSPRLCGSEREATLQTTLGNGLSGPVNGTSSLKPKSHWQKNLSGESHEATRKMRMNGCLDKQDLTDDTPPAKVVKHDEDVILDLSINSKTPPTDGIGRIIKTNNSVYNNDECLLRNTVCNSQNSPVRTEQKYEPNCHDSADEHFFDNTPQHDKSEEHVGSGKPQHGKSAGHQVDSGTHTRSVEPFRKCSRPEIVASSFDMHEASSGTHRQSCSPVSKYPLREIADNFTHTKKSSPCRTLPSLEIKSEMIPPYQGEFHALTAFGDQEPRGLLGSEFESAKVKHEADSLSYSSTPIQFPEVLSSSDLPVPPDVYINTTYDNRKSISLGRLNVPPSSLFCDGELPTNKPFSAAASPAHVKCLEHSLESKESPLLFNVCCVNGKSPVDCDSYIFRATRLKGRKLYPGTNKETILHVNEMYMVADTLTDPLHNSPQRADGHRISRELAAVDEIFADIYGYSPIKVTHFWKDLHSSLSRLNFNKWRGGTLSPPQVGWLRDITRIYSEQVRACEDGALTPADSNYPSPALAEGMDRWKHLTDMLTRRACADDMHFLQFPGMDKVQLTDRVQLEHNPRFFGNIVLMASREWFDPFLRKFNFLGNLPLSGTEPCSSFQSRMTRLGSQICNLRLDRTEAAIMAALNVVGAEDGSCPNLSQASGLPETITKVLGCYLYTINVDPYERIPELLSVMPKVHLMTMWYFTLMKNMETNTSRRGEKSQDFTAKLSPGGKLAR